MTNKQRNNVWLSEAAKWSKYLDKIAMISEAVNSVLHSAYMLQKIYPHAGLILKGRNSSVDVELIFGRLICRCDDAGCDVPDKGRASSQTWWHCTGCHSTLLLLGFPPPETTSLALHIILRCFATVPMAASFKRVRPLKYHPERTAFQFIPRYLGLDLVSSYRYLSASKGIARAVEPYVGKQGRLSACRRLEARLCSFL